MFTYCPPKQLQDLKSETFPDGRRFYTVPITGEKLPSITTVLGAIKKDTIMKWRQRVGEQEANRISRKSSGRGTNVHTLCERYLNNDTEYAKKAMPDALDMFKSIKPYLDTCVSNIWYQEQSLWSKQLGVAGRVDLIAHWNGTLSVIDFKTSSKIKTKEHIQDYFWQECAYALMLEEMIGEPIHQLVTLMAVENENTLVFIEKTEDHIEGLVKSINFYKQNS